MNLVLGTLVMQNNKILILKRSRKVLTYTWLWDFVGWYLDDAKPPEQKAIDELEEEIGISGSEDVLSIQCLKRIVQYDDVINKVWVNFPTMIILKDNAQIILDEEHDEYKWVTKDELEKYELVPGTLALYDYIQTFNQNS